MKICKNCNSVFSVNYCQHCGQKDFNKSDKTITKIFAEVFQNLFNWDNALLRTVKILLLKPGQLSIDYCNGKQKSIASKTI